MATEIKDGKLYVDGQQCCYRCGMAKQSAEIREGWKCSGWGITHRTHLWTLREPKAKRRHKWFVFKDDPFRCCKDCGCIETKKNTDGRCTGKVRVTLR